MASLRFRFGAFAGGGGGGGGGGDTHGNCGGAMVGVVTVSPEE
jgi:hypothetical protein